MWRAVTIIAVVLIVLVFTASNMHPTRVDFPFTRGFETRTAFVSILCFTLGYAISSLVAFVRRVKNRGRGPGENVEG